MKMSNPKCGICKEYMKHHNSCMRRACHAQFEKDYSAILSMKPSSWYDAEFNFETNTWEDLSGNRNDMKRVSNYAKNFPHVSLGISDIKTILKWEAFPLADIDTYKLGKGDK